jgi:HD superfamily phosphodiesterase
MRQRIAGVVIPTGRLAEEAERIACTIYADPLFHHARRVFLFAMLHGRARGIVADPQLCYAGAMFHDWESAATCLTYRAGPRLAAADQVRDFLTAHGAVAEEADRMWHAVAVHSAPDDPARPVAATSRGSAPAADMEPEAELLNAGVLTDVQGLGLWDLDPDLVDAVHAAHPRLGFPEPG